MAIAIDVRGALPRCSAEGVIMLVLLYAPPAVRLIGLATVFDLFAAANAQTTMQPRYDVRLVTDMAEPLRSESGVTMLPDATIADMTEQADMLIVAACDGHAPPPVTLAMRWLRRQAAGAARYGAIGNGAFLLGYAGLLDGAQVTVHRDDAAVLAAQFPLARVEPDRIYVRDRALFSSAGDMATADLMLALIEEDHGRALALDLARGFVMFMKRSGGQAQVSNLLSTQAAMRDPIQRVQQHIYDDPTGDLSIASLAAVAAMSPRNFARVFRQETGMRPSVFVERGRVNLAKRMLEESALPPQQIARMAGFTSSEAARRAFRRQTGETLTDYRARRPHRPHDRD